MPSVCRRIAALVVVACLGVILPAQVALAQGAGDQQYSDPFGGSGTSTTKASSTTTAATTTTAPGLSATPQGSSTPKRPTRPTRPTTTAPIAAAQLPSTGLDARVLVLLGAALLLGGLGLRLRSAPERF